MSDEKTKKRSESDEQDEVEAHLYVGDSLGEDDPEKKRKRHASERPDEDEFGKKKK